MVRREYPEAPIVGVGAVVLEANRVLLVRRAQPPLMGEWSIPGGALELGETLEAGIRREVTEETGLEVKVAAMVEVLDRIVFEDAPIEEKWAEATSEGGAGKRTAQPKGAGRIRYHYVLIDFLCVAIGGRLNSGSDAADARWIAREELASPTYRVAPVTIAVIEKAFRMAEAMTAQEP